MPWGFLRAGACWRSRRWGEEERWNERALPARAKRGICNPRRRSPRRTREPRHGRYVLSNSFQSPTVLRRGAFCGQGRMMPAAASIPSGFETTRVQCKEKQVYDRLAPQTNFMSKQQQADTHSKRWVPACRLNRSFNNMARSAHFGPGGNPVVQHQQVEALLAVLGVNSRDQHAVGLQAHHLPRGKVDNGHQGLAH